MISSKYRISVKEAGLTSLIVFCLCLMGLSRQSFANEVLTPEKLLQMKQVSLVALSPDGEWIAYVLSVPRKATDAPGPAYRELHLVSPKTGENRPFITGDADVSAIAWRPDGQLLSFTSKRSGSTQVWGIPVDGGEAYQLTHAASNVLFYRWHPAGTQIGYIATTPESARQKALSAKGYDFIYFEEDLSDRNIYLEDISSANHKTTQLSSGASAWSFEFSPDGTVIAAGMSDKNLIDHRYAFQVVYLLDVERGSRRQISQNKGKLGNFVFSPDGRTLAYAASYDRKDHAVSQAYTVSVASGEVSNHTPENLKGHINWIGWKDNKTVVYRSGEGVHQLLCTANIKGNKRKVILNSADNGIIFGEPSYTGNFKKFAFTGNTPSHPNEVYFWEPGKTLRRLTITNPWLVDTRLGQQKAMQFKASDGVSVEGLLIYPVGYQSGAQYPLIVQVHGGPESHYSNGWITRYSNPGQVLAGKGYLVYYPNYRSSTGYGLEYAAVGHNDAAGREFDDIADGIDHLIASGLADKERVGLGGGSYGGFASAWFSSYYTAKVKAVCMFVGISNLISKRGTTDIPYEELYVHSGKKLEEMWEQSLKRSPIYYAHQSKTAVLIYGGAADTRVHPTQSVEYFRRLKMNDHPAVRLVQYPGEPHGNRKQPGQADVLYRQLDWYDWYVQDARPLDGPMPPLDISNKYGITLPE